MPKRKPSQRREPETTPQQQRDRLAEIRTEIQDVQQQIETKRRDGRTTRDWQRFSRTIITLANGRCELAYQGCTGRAQHAHKIGQGEHTLDPTLYRAACPHCHQLHHTGYGQRDDLDPFLIA